jgi:hypothetical protein
VQRVASSASIDLRFDGRRHEGTSLLFEERADATPT